MIFGTVVLLSSVTLVAGGDVVFGIGLASSTLGGWAGFLTLGVGASLVWRVTLGGVTGGLSGVMCELSMSSLSLLITAGCSATVSDMGCINGSRHVGCFGCVGAGVGAVKIGGGRFAVMLCNTFKIVSNFSYVCMLGGNIGPACFVFLMECTMSLSFAKHHVG